MKVLSDRTIRIRRRLNHAAAAVSAAIVMLAGGPHDLAGAETASAWRTLPLVSHGKIDENWIQVGWGGFVIDDGALRTAPDPRGLGLLVYRKERIGNCQLRLVFKAKEAKSNGGIYVRLSDGILDQVGHPGAAYDRNAAGKISTPSMDRVKVSAEREEGPWYAVHNGYEIQLMDSGDAFHRTGSIYSLAPSTATPKPGEWRTMIITLAGERITVDLDGARTTDFRSDSPEIPPRKKWPEPKREPRRPTVGFIGLQNHDPGDIVWIKEVSVRSLPLVVTESNRR
jgi:hypothetical protein